MNKTSTNLKNVFFQDQELFLEGEANFNSKQFEKALDNFTQLSQQSPSNRKFVAGRIAITLMKLEDFEQAKEFLRESIVERPEMERDYFSLMAECLYGLGRYEETAKKCGEIFQKYPNLNNSDVEELEKKVSIYPNFQTIRENFQEETISDKAYENIINILKRDEAGEDEAFYYAQSLVNSGTNKSITPYLFLLDYYKKTYSTSESLRHLYSGSLYLLENLKKSLVRLDEKNVLYKKILSVYERSPCYRLSKYYVKPTKVEAWDPFVNVAELKDRAKMFAAFFKTKHVPVLNLDYYFARELQFAQS